MMSSMPPICVLCAHFMPGAEQEDNVSRCKAFPDGIPQEILDGFDHRQPFQSEKVLFKLSPDASGQELMEWVKASVAEGEAQVDAEMGPMDEP